MTDALQKALLIAFVAAGGMLFVRYEMGGRPARRIAAYAGVWLAVGFGGLVLLCRKPEQRRP